MSFATGRIVLAALLLVSASSWVAAQSPAAGDTDDPPPVTFGSGRTLSLFPAGDVYPVYIADPHKTESGVMAQFHTQTEIPDSETYRTGLKAGGRFGLLRLDPATPGGRSWQLSADAGLRAQFDSRHKHDAVGWDGNYGVTLTTASAAPFAFKVAILHQSAHIGDEYAERTGRARINYTREEVAVGVDWRLSRGGRLYLEGGYAYHLLAEGQAPGRAQAGFEYQTGRRIWGGRFAWYAALDLAATEERDWRLDWAVQTGLAMQSRGRRWRIGVEYYEGRPQLGEFFRYSEAWLALGLWMDL